MQERNMNKDDEIELYRLTNLLSDINIQAKLKANQIEALKKAALSLSVSFIHGHRKEIEELYHNRNEELTAKHKNTLDHWASRMKRPNRGSAFNKSIKATGNSHVAF
jgi:hypothetical protein